MDTTIRDFTAQLRWLADTLDEANLPDAATIDLSLGIHWIRDRDTLRQWAAIMSKPEAWSRNGTHAVSGEIGVFRMHVYYSAGLLGPTKSVRFVQEEDSPDLGSLLSGAAEPTAELQES